MSPLDARKDSLRRLARNLPKISDDERRLKSLKVVEIISARDEFRSAKQVAIFYPLSYEVDLLPLWEKRPESVFFPKSFSGFQLDFFRVRSLKDLKAGYAQIPEPEAWAEFQARAWQDSDLILVPGLLFDPWGGRLGTGKGFYDRFLTANPAKKWGVCFQGQLWKEKLAQEPTDVRMEAVVTEVGWVKSSGSV